MNQLDQKINQYFPGLVVRKDLVKLVKGNAIVPTYVLEYLLGQYCATDDEESIKSGIDTVKEILRKHYVHRSEAGLVRSIIREQGRHKVIDKISVDLNDKRDAYEATFSNLGINRVLVSPDVIKQHPKLLVSGVWCIADMEYQYFEDQRMVPWIMNSIKPIQLSHFDIENYKKAREAFTLEEWIDILVQSIGFDPEMLGQRNKLMQIVRLIPYCERNYNLIELGPKGTGKSHIYSEFSPHGILISGGEVTVPKLFVNNATNQIGLVGFWDVVAFDEFAGKKRVQQALVDIMKNYMANKSFSRGVETITGEASMVFVGNTQHTLPYMLKHTGLFSDLPEQYYDSAFLDRLHFYLPGWEIDIIRGEMFSEGYGFVVDYLAEILSAYREFDLTQRYSSYFELATDLSTRDLDGTLKTFSGLMKILFPHEKATKEEIEMILKFAMEGRKRIKDQLMRMDPTYASVHFAYKENGQEGKRYVKTLEQMQYPQYFPEEYTEEEEMTEDALEVTKAASLPREEAKEQHLKFVENQKGVTFEYLFGLYLEGANEITITDPYILHFYQARNVMELLETIAEIKPEDEEVEVHLITSRDNYPGSRQPEYLEDMAINAQKVGIHFTYEYKDSSAIHARHIVTDTRWKILLDRGLDIFQPYDMNDAFTFANRLQSQRACKAFEVTYLRVED